MRSLVGVFCGLLFVLLSSAANAACTTPNAVEGGMNYFAAPDSTYKYCDGSNWIKMMGSPPKSFIELNASVPTITASTSGFVTAQTLNWVAPATGNVLVTFYKNPPYVFTCAAGHLHIGLEFAGQSKYAAMTNVGRFSSGDVHYTPIILFADVTAGNTYEIKKQYYAQALSSCTINLTGNSSLTDSVTIEYVQ